MVLVLPRPLIPCWFIRVLRAAYEDDRVQDRLKLMNPFYGGFFVQGTPHGNKFKAMAIMEMMMGSKQEAIDGPVKWDWSPPEGEGSASPSRIVTYLPTVVFTKDQQLRPMRPDLFKIESYILMDCTVLSSSTIGAPKEVSEIVGERLDFEGLKDKVLWTVRLPL